MDSLRGIRHVTSEQRLQHHLGRVVIDANTGCWFSDGNKSNQGYRVIRVNYRSTRLHKFVYEQIVGPVEDGKQLHHTCGNKACLYPRHMEQLTASEHTRAHPEGREKIIAMRLARTHCARGHEYTPENTFTPVGTNSRECRICRRASWNRYDARRRP